MLLAKWQNVYMRSKVAGSGGEAVMRMTSRWSAGTEDKGAGKAKEDVVDAEFEEVKDDKKQ